MVVRRAHECSLAMQILSGHRYYARIATMGGDDLRYYVRIVGHLRVAYQATTSINGHGLPLRKAMLNDVAMGPHKY